MNQTQPKYRILLKPDAKSWLRRCDSKNRQRITDQILKLGYQPRPSGCKKLVGQEKYRIRVGDYRVIYEVSDSQLLVLVVRIGHRREICRR